MARRWWIPAVPMAALTAFVTLAIHVRLYVGRWPGYGEFNAAGKGAIDFYDGATFLLLALWFFSAPVLLPTALVLAYRKRRGYYPQLATYLGASTLIVLLFLLDPFGFRTWFCD